MKIKAYVLAADPAWIEESVLSYYDIVDEIVVSYDKDQRGWTGADIPVAVCLQKLRALDRDRKMRFCPGHYSRLDQPPMENDTYQRQCALAEVGADTDWVLQCDTDEVLPNPVRLIDFLKRPECNDASAIEWPMRVLFRRLPGGRFLEVCRKDKGSHFEYPGPIAVRPGVKLVNARRAEGPMLRAAVIGDQTSLQIRQPLGPQERRIAFCQDEDAIQHFSWARTAAEIRSKMASWGHSGLKCWLTYHLCWKSAPYLWPLLREFHPLCRELWPALKLSDLVLPIPGGKRCSGNNGKSLERIA